MDTNGPLLLDDPFVRLPSRKELVLFLIGKELKNTRLFGKLGEVGLETDHYYLDFDSLILSLMEFGQSLDEDDRWDWYCTLLHETADHRQVNDEEDLKERIYRFYAALQEKRKRFVQTQSIAS